MYVCKIVIPSSHAYKMGKYWFYKEHILVLDWLSQSSYLNSIKNFSNDVKCTIVLQKYIKLMDLRIEDLSQRTLSPKSHAVLENRGCSTECWSNKLKTLIFLLFIKLYNFYSRNLCYFTDHLKPSVCYVAGLKQMNSIFVKIFVFF